ncbi:MAG: D-alanyl-D-alanine carboxypeptidase/D-alanyl-D-alanine-endopeptidase [Pyrinomonadaceae bacterium]|nr:D-alanyl-D-alanine carboxypeptidase/D-alanyl-D-alanine-endopeptidase [Pyrinomonadaceae bacterium]
MNVPQRQHRRLAILGLFLLTIFTVVHIDGQIIARPRTTPTPAANPSPTPVPTPTIAVQTIESLQSKIRQRLFAPEVRRGRVGIKIASLNSGKVLFENDAEKYFMPASNMKNFTVATAIEKLTPSFRFMTHVKAPALPDAEGIIRGNLTVIGAGDVSISTSFSDGDYYKGLDQLAEKIRMAGVKRIEGDIVGDVSYFRGFALPATWEWDDLQAYYGAEVSALPLNDNAVDLTVIAGSTGNACIARVSPFNSLMRIVNSCVTTARGTKRNLSVVKLINQNVIEISGTMPAGDAEYSTSIAMTNVAELFVALLKQRLESKGITVTGKSRVADDTLRTICPTCPPVPSVNITSLESPPFSVIAAKTMKPSQNMYTETILWTLGEQIGRKNDAKADSSTLGIGVVRSFLREIGVPADGIIQYDGSGLSRHDLITPSAVVTLYTYMAKQSPFSQVWRDSLTIGGVDGTLRNRFKGTAAAGNIRGKTGTIDQVSALSGYVKTAAGEELVVSIIVNGVAETRMRTSLIDDIVVYLANFNGTID